MPASVYIVVRFRANAGQADDLRQTLGRLVAPTRQEPGCHQYDLLQSPADPHDLCIVERWEDEASLTQHMAGEALRRTLGEARAFMDGTPQGGRFALVN